LFLSETSFLKADGTVKTGIRMRSTPKCDNFTPSIAAISRIHGNHDIQIANEPTLVVTSFSSHVDNIVFEFDSASKIFLSFLLQK
jgi:hypothetical protein